MLDIAGPFKIQNPPSANPEKVYALVYFCLYTRAVWFISVENLSAGALHNAILRTQARFGAARTIFSDNGTNLRAVGRVTGEERAELPREVLDELVAMQSDEFGSSELLQLHGSKEGLRFSLNLLNKRFW